MAKVTVMVMSVVVQYVTVNDADIDDENAIVENAVDESEGKLEEHDFTVDHTNTRVKWEH